MSHMTPAEFAAKCECEGVEYAVTDYGLSAGDVEVGTPLHAAMLAVDAAKKPWMDAAQFPMGGVADWYEPFSGTYPCEQCGKEVAELDLVEGRCCSGRCFMRMVGV